MNKSLIIVDIQPSYHKYCQEIITNPKFKQLIDKTERILLYFNGEDYSGSLDTHSRMKQYITDFLGTTCLSKINLTEKDYGFIRDWMDDGISDTYIIRAFRYMIIRNISNSLDIPESDLLNIIDNDLFDVASKLEIYLPDKLSLRLLKEYSKGYICGGFGDECLKEIELVMNSFNLNYTRLKEFTYHL